MNLNKILSDLEAHKSINRSATLEKYISERLTKSVQSYYNEIDENIMQLYKYDSLKVMKKMEKEKEKYMEDIMNEFN